MGKYEVVVNDDPEVDEIQPDLVRMGSTDRDSMNFSAYSADDSVDGDQQSQRLTRPGLLGRAYYRFRRFWNRNLPENWSGESDPHTVWSHLLRVVSLLIIAALVLALPSLLNLIAPTQLVAPGASSDPGLEVSAQSGYQAAVAADNSHCSEMGTKVATSSGGSVADAVVVAALCQGVMHPHTSGLGGSALILYYDAGKKETVVYDGLVNVPDGFDKSSVGKEDARGANVGVPGFLRALETFHKAHGKLAWKSLVLEVSKLAEEWEVSPHFAEVLRTKSDYILEHDVLKQYFTRPFENDELIPEVDDIVLNKLVVLKAGENASTPELASTLKDIAKHGSKSLYDNLSKQLSEEINTAGGKMNESDFKTYEARKYDPISFYIDGYKIWTSPPPSSGAILAKALSILEGYRLRRRGRNGLAYHLVIEASKLAFEDWEMMFDPTSDANKSSENIKKMLDKDNAQANRAGLNLKIASRKEVETLPSNLRAAALPEIARNYAGTHIAATDSGGSAVSFTATLGSEFADGLYSNLTGILLNNELFLAIDSNAELKPKNRPISGMAPVVIEDFKRVQFAFGSAGGAASTQTMIETILNAVEYGDDLATAIAAPRMTFELSNSTVYMEGIHPEDCATTAIFRRSSGAPFSYWEEVCTSLKSFGYSVSAMEGTIGVDGISVADVQTETGDMSRKYFAFTDPRYKNSQASAL
ncbi:hypothetical protein NDN08_007994 [Rhodosorus marinus]|uniref:Gamma-glutamyltransferase n=1 Tax=Rhodosorus marinus TaxID=101924 RepID=A0AAV8V1Y3_9RHOD|nr:hypothetical protein NDN08_007994 [Rhodosorus marinus]